MIDPVSSFVGRAEVSMSARQLLARLSPGVRTFIGRLLEVMEHAARSSSVPVSRTEMVTHQDPEDGTEKVEIRQWVRASDETAMDLWDVIGQEVDEWVNSLPEADADLLAEAIAFAVYSDVDDAAA